MPDGGRECNREEVRSGLSKNLQDADRDFLSLAAKLRIKSEKANA